MSDTLKFVECSLASGDEMAPLGCVAVPANPMDLLHKPWAKRIKDKSGNATAFS